MKIHISNQEEFDHKVAQITEAGIHKLHVISDFDRTLTQCFFEGKKLGSGFALLRDGNYLSEEYTAEDRALFEEYYPYEISETITDEERYTKMDEWWIKHLQVMVKHGMTSEVISQAAKDFNKMFRPKTKELLTYLEEHDVPLLLFSAGIGELIEGLITNMHGRVYENIHILANFCEYNEHGTIIGYTHPPIHVMNKNEGQVAEHKYSEFIEDRPNVLLLGDNLNDAEMAEGMQHDTVLRIGFLNEKIDARLDKYLDAYDVVITDDGPMDFVYELIQSF